MIEIKKDITQKLLANLKQIVTRGVYVGIPGGEHRTEGKLTNSDIAFINEFGSDHKNIPARPFLRPAIAKSKPNIIKIFKDGALKALDGEDLNITYEKAGMYARDQVKNWIVGGQGFAPLKQSTIKARANRRSDPSKTPTKPLIDTAQMLNSITYVVRDK